MPDERDSPGRPAQGNAPGSHGDPGTGAVVALVSAKGGAGVSFLSVNLAAEIAPTDSACVLDLDFSMGDAAAFLDLQPRSGIRDLFGDPDGVGERLISESIAVHASGIHVLAQPAELVESIDVRGADVMQVMRAVAAAYRYVLVDCGGRIDAATRAATHGADLVLLVTTPSVVSVRNASRRLQLMQRSGIARDRIRLVVNKVGRGNELTQQDIEKELGMEVAATIADDQAGCEAAVNAGQLLRDVEPRSVAYADITATVDLIRDRARTVRTGGRAKPFWNIFR
ncbi:MAG: AAA family ATPase [Myxococcota bacterium]|nr:AAA family ATPase [Myxococcota bacterium]